MNDERQTAAESAAQNGAAPPETAADESQASELDQLRSDLEAARDKLLRAQADFDNYQKRIHRERNEERRYAHLPLLRDLLPVRDNLQRALEAAEKPQGQAGASSLLEGVQLVAQQLKTVFEQYGCREIAAQGAEFDPHLHDALTMQPSDEHPANRILSVFRPGYQLHDRVLRPAQVVVSSGPAQEKPQGANEQSSQTDH